MLKARQVLFFAALSIAIFDSASGQSQQPSADSKAPNNQSSQPPASDERGTDKAPLAVKILPGQPSKEQTAKEERERREQQEKAAVDKRLADETQRLADRTHDTAFYTSVLAGFTLLLFFAAVGQIYLFAWQLRLIKGESKRAAESIDLARKEFLSTHRPRLRVRNVVLENPQPTYARQWNIFAPNHPIMGQLYISNVGDTDATITDSHCMVFWTKEPLPMKRPYEGELGNEFAGHSVIAPGGSTVGAFITLDKLMGQEGHLIALGKDGWKLYVLGWVTYVDSQKNALRRTAFCREYRVLEDSGRGRFFRVEDPDYEHEE